ncbi:MAG: hydroxyphenylacetyl-CoA thioesterase PaaI [Kiritimatiellae bacterium]|nr:hydroxyphenylacetyl-CoA thioesterase PaaI [Kiritimatiellia bacterium]
MEHIRKFFSEQDKLGRHLGVEILEVGKGTARAKMRVKEEHLNGVRTCHGGAMFTLADVVFAAACNSYGTVAVAINVNISFLKAVGLGATLWAEAREISLNPRLGTYEIRVTDDQGELVANFEGLAYRKKDPLPLDP